MAASIGEYTNLGMPSLGTATGTRVDSAAKHIMACKVDAKLLHLWSNAGASDNSAQYMHSRKLQFCMHKDELVMNTTNPMIPSNAYMSGTQAAYPLVVTTLAEVPHKIVQLLCVLYASNTLHTFRKRADAFTLQKTKDVFDVQYHSTEDERKKFCNTLSQLPDLRCQGVALGQGFPSYMSGDSVASVLIGGMVTIANGAWDMHPGDLVQWYFDSEENWFHAVDNTDVHRITHRAGSRKLIGADDAACDALLLRHDGPHNHNFNAAYANILGGALGTNHRREWGDRNMGFNVAGNHGYGDGNALYGKKDAKRIFRIKSYQPAYNENGGDIKLKEVYGDKIRVFAKCISGGRAFDQVDIMIMTQSS